MKRYCRWIFTLLLVLSLSVEMAGVVLAAEGASVLTVKDLQGDFQVTPGSEQSQSDLFSSFKGVMPGDVCTETIEIRNRTAEHKPLRLFLTSVSPNPEQKESVAELLSMLNIRIWADDTLVFDATADTSSNQPVSLGVIPYRKSAEMRIELTVPVAVNSQQARNMAQIQWFFSAEDASDSSAPQTGDSSHLALWIVLCIVSLVGVVGVFLWSRKRK